MAILWAVLCGFYYVNLVIAYIADDISVNKIVFYAAQFLFFALLMIKEEIKQ